MEEFALLTFIMLMALGAYWSLVIFPKQRDFTKRQRFARELAEGDEIITYGGIVGKVLSIDSEKGIAQVEIADGVVIRLILAAMMQEYDPEVIAENARKGLEKTALEDVPGMAENR